jgi:hypothetical protein
MGFVEPALGSRMHSFGVVLEGALLTEGRWIDFLHEVAQAIGMSPVADPVVFTYPLNDKGGTGQTVFLPITESFLALDTWPDHHGAYLFVCSCRPYFSADIDRVAAEFGLKPARDNGRRFYAELNLK